MMMTKIQDTGEKFNLQLYLEGQRKTKDLVKRFSSEIKTGMQEKEAVEILDQELKVLGCERCWHPHKIRFGQNTIKSFSEKSDESIKLKTEDIFFVDIGPNWNQHETDYGETFFLGKNLEFQKMATKAEDLFKMTQEVWREKKITGQELYQFLKVETEKAGYLLNLNSDGHRLGDFPHALFFKGSLMEINETPLPHVWILEVHITNKDRTFGAFYEDLLI